MSAASTTAPKRDNLFGVCAAIGADFGFDPFYLRLALAVAVIVAPVAVLVGYAAAAALVVLSNVLFRSRPVPTRSATIHGIAPAATAAPAYEPLLEAA